MTIRVELRPVQFSDLPTLFQYQREPEANQMAAFPARTEDAFHALWAKLLADETVDKFAIIVKNHDAGFPTAQRAEMVGETRLAGNIVAWNQDDRRWVGYWIGREFWNQGICSEALRQYLSRWRSESSAEPLSAWVAKQNPASIRILQKCGFRQYGEKDEEFLFELT